MNPLPQHIQDHLQSLGINLADCAYLHVTTAGQIIHIGGALAAFKLNDLRIGQDMTRHPTLSHLLPIKSAAVMPDIQITPGVYANLHLSPENDWAWLVFVNVTTSATERQQQQQKRNDAALQRHRDAKKS